MAKMEENAFVINIATILAKDIALDEGNNLKRPRHFLLPKLANPGRTPAEPLPLLKSDDEGFAFFLQQQKLFEEAQAKKQRLNISTAHEGDPYTFCINFIKGLDVNIFEGTLHLSKQTFKKLLDSVCQLIRPFSLRGQFINAEITFTLGLWKLATDEHFEEISRRFRVPLECHVIIRHFWNIISENYETFIRWPNSHESQMNCLAGFRTLKPLKVFQNLFGVIAIKRLDIFLESEDEETSVIMQIICSAKHTIIDCFVELASKYSFEASPIGQTLEINRETIPPNSYLIGDCSFPLKQYLMRPFKVECFRVETIFNKLLQPAIDIANQVLHRMTKRFNTLYALEAKDMTEVRKVVETICSLHNLCQQYGDNCVESVGNVPSTAQHSIQGNESNQYGRKIRFELMDKIVK